MVLRALLAPGRRALDVLRQPSRGGDAAGAGEGGADAAGAGGCGRVRAGAGGCGGGCGRVRAGAGEGVAGCGRVRAGAAGASGMVLAAECRGGRRTLSPLKSREVVEQSRCTLPG